MLVKTVTRDGVTTTINYNGNKVINSSSTDGQNHTFTYNGDFIIKDECIGSLIFTNTYSYSNNLIVSDNLIFNPSGESYNRTYTHNLDGSITENLTITNPGNFVSSYINKLYYLQGNLIKEEVYYIYPDNPTPTLSSTTTYTYDNKNTPYRSVTGSLAIIPNTKNNVISEIKKNSSNIVTESIQYSYQYNSNDYPLDCIRVRTPYSTSSGITIPGTPTTTTEYFTYY
jgi:hypothetical protein